MALTGSSLALDGPARPATRHAFIRRNSALQALPPAADGRMGRCGAPVALGLVGPSLSVNLLVRMAPARHSFSYGSGSFPSERWIYERKS